MVHLGTRAEKESVRLADPTSEEEDRPLRLDPPALASPGWYSTIAREIGASPRRTTTASFVSTRWSRRTAALSRPQRERLG